MCNIVISSNHNILEYQLIIIMVLVMNVYKITTALRMKE